MAHHLLGTLTIGQAPRQDIVPISIAMSPRRSAASTADCWMDFLSPI